MREHQSGRQLDHLCHRPRRPPSQFTLDRGPVDLADLVDDLRPRLDDIAGGPGIVACTVEPVPAITGDHEHLERVLLNLVRNALEATTRTNNPDTAGGTRPDPGEPRVRVRVAPTPTGTPPGVVLDVTDTGPGMTDEVRDRAVEPFFRAYTSLGGAGLGLAIVHGIVTQHGGTLDIDSTSGAGTTIRVTLPVDPTPPPD